MSNNFSTGEAYKMKSAKSAGWATHETQWTDTPLEMDELGIKL